MLFSFYCISCRIQFPCPSSDVIFLEDQLKRFWKCYIFSIDHPHTMVLLFYVLHAVFSYFSLRCMYGQRHNATFLIMGVMWSVWAPQVKVYCTGILIMHHHVIVLVVTWVCNSVYMKHAQSSCPQFFQMRPHISLQTFLCLQVSNCLCFRTTEISWQNIVQ